MRFKIDWASLIIGSKFTVLPCFNLYLRAIFQVQAPGGLIFGGAILRRVFCITGLGCLYLEGLIHGGAYFWNFTVSDWNNTYHRNPVGRGISSDRDDRMGAKIKTQTNP